MHVDNKSRVCSLSFNPPIHQTLQSRIRKHMFRVHPSKRFLMQQIIRIICVRLIRNCSVDISRFSSITTVPKLREIILPPDSVQNHFLNRDTFCILHVRIVFARDVIEYPTVRISANRKERHGSNWKLSTMIKVVRFKSRNLNRVTWRNVAGKRGRGGGEGGRGGGAASLNQ
jgi:hypothetical protein